MGVAAKPGLALANTPKALPPIAELSSPVMCSQPKTVLLDTLAALMAVKASLHVLSK